MRILVRVLLLVTVALAFGFHLFQSGTGAQSLSPEGIPLCTQAPGGMVGWWPGEGTAEDIRGDNNGSLNGNGFSSGEVEQAFSFSTITGVTVPDTPVLKPQQLTIDAWVTARAFSCNGCEAFIASKSGTDGNSGYELGVTQFGNIDFLFNGGLGGARIITKTTIADGLFHHIAATYDGFTMKVFIDGFLDSQLSVTTTINYAAGQPFVIGSRGLTQGATSIYPGLIDEVEFYGRPLSAQEIQSIVSAGSLGKCRPRCTPPPFGLLGWWTGDDNPFDIWSTHHGSLENGATYGQGKVGRAFSFDGVNDFVSIPASPDWNFGANDFTVDLWVKFNQIKNSMFIHKASSSDGPSHSPSGTPAGWEFNYQVGTNQLFFNLDPSTIGISRPWLPVANIWYHLAVTRFKGEFRLFVDGVQLGSSQLDERSIPAQFGILKIGGYNLDGDYEMNGLIDEVEIFNRALDFSEISALNNAASAGKCKPCYPPPSNMVGWWNGDANTRDDSLNGNAGVLQGGYALGKVGQAFSLDARNNDGVIVPSSSSLNPTNAITLDAWVKPLSYPNLAPTVIRKEQDNNGVQYLLAIGDGLTPGVAHCNIGGFAGPAGGSVPLNQWSHVACTYDGQTTRLFVNGVAVASATAPQPTPIPTSSASLAIGRQASATDRNFDGLIDEAEVFDRALSEVEIQSIVAAGASGKCKVDFSGARSPAGSQTIQLGDATITFNAVISTGVTTYQTLGNYQAGPMPFGYNAPLEVADIVTDTFFDSTSRVCFNLRSADFTGPFQQLRVLHLENNKLVNRTSFSDSSTRTLCADVDSFSPFVIAQNVTVPSAASGSINGRIRLPDGTPLGGVVIELTGNESRETITDASGYFSFTEIETGGFYTVRPQGANLSFSPRERSFSQIGSQTEAVFTALPDVVQTVNPLDTNLFFVRQQYLDFLGREPDAGGLVYWTDQLNRCSSDASCLRNRREEVSAAFFDSSEFQETGSFIYRLYKAGLGRLPRYQEFLADRQQVTGGVTGDAAQLAFAEQFVGRVEFVERYQAYPTGETFVDALLQSVRSGSNTDLDSMRASLLGRYHTGRDLADSRALVLTALDQSVALRRAEYNPGFVLMEYFGYLRRDADAGGYRFWLDVLNNRVAGNYRSMVCAFITSAEYQQRFSSIISRTNSDCGR